MKRINQIIKLLSKEYPNAGIAIKFGDDFQLLVAVILSAQCTDERVNMVTPPLFKRFPKIENFANCDLAELEKIIYSTGFYKNKAKNIKGAAQKIINEYDGKIPGSMKELLKLPGVARKTANVILYEAFGVSEGIVVDTHVCRVSGRLGLVSEKLSKAKNAIKIEQELVKIVPKKDWRALAHLFIWHGRKICIAKKPKCRICVLNKICPGFRLD